VVTELGLVDGGTKSVGDTALAGDRVIVGGRTEGTPALGGAATSTEVMPNKVGDVEGLTVMVRRKVELSGRSMTPMNPIDESKSDLRMIDSQATIISTVALESADVLI